jgi:hypothetical protein
LAIWFYGGAGGAIGRSSESWITAATTPYSNDVLFTAYGSDYGYYWWLFLLGEAAPMMT